MVMRTTKIDGDKYTHYIWAGDNLIAETRGEEITIPQELAFEMAPRTVITYLYGATGIIGFTLAGTPYYYQKNLQGDVTHIIGDNNNLIASYSYDAWGKCEIISDIDGIGETNPIRYRGYYYDSETGLYYLKSRYYDPETGRFINIDNINYLEPAVINGLNLYAYCLNNPVMLTDPDGTSSLRQLWNNFRKLFTREFWESVIRETRDFFVEDIWNDTFRHLFTRQFWRDVGSGIQGFSDVGRDVLRWRWDNVARPRLEIVRPVFTRDFWEKTLYRIDSVWQSRPMQFIALLFPWQISIVKWIIDWLLTLEFNQEEDIVFV